MTRSWLFIIAIIGCLGTIFSACGQDNPTAETTPADAPFDTNSYGYPWKTNVNYGRLVDARDGQVYRTVTIGKQTWMAQNLNFNTDSSRCYLDSIRYCSIYGRFYQWAAAMNLPATANKSVSNSTSPNQGICPSGWHLPGRAEWDTLNAYVGGASTSGTKLKSSAGWPSNTNGSDSLGFRILPAGCLAGAFKWVDQFALFWSATEVDASWAVRTYYGDYPDFRKTNDYKTSSFSVRCIKD